MIQNNKYKDKTDRYYTLAFFLRSLQLDLKFFKNIRQNDGFDRTICQIFCIYNFEFAQNLTKIQKIQVSEPIVYEAPVIEPIVQENPILEQIEPFVEETPILESIVEETPVIESTSFEEVIPTRQKTPTCFFDLIQNKLAPNL